jgi:acetyl-CoA carboxylase carboxyl transferase subunit alpha
VPEPAGGAHRDHDEAARLLREALLEALTEVGNIPQGELRSRRRAKFRSMGVLA